MSRVVRGGLIQATLCEPSTSPVAAVKKAMIDKHVALIADAARQGAQVVCLQELFYGPYFCAEQQARWYELTERVPDGPTTKLMAELATTARDRADRAGVRRRPDGRLLQHGRRDRRRRPLPRQVSQDAHPALSRPASGRSFTSGPATWVIRSSRRGWARSAFTSATTAIFRKGLAAWV